MTEKLECPTCRKIEMFRNQANSLTCGSCGQLIFPISAEEHRKLYLMLQDSKVLIEHYAKTVELLEQLKQVYEKQRKV